MHVVATGYLIFTNKGDFDIELLNGLPTLQKLLI